MDRIEIIVQFVCVALGALSGCLTYDFLLWSWRKFFKKSSKKY